MVYLYSLSYETVHSGERPHSVAVYLSMYVFTVYKSTHLGVSSIRRGNANLVNLE